MFVGTADQCLDGDHLHLEKTGHLCTILVLVDLMAAGYQIKHKYDVFLLLI